MAFLGIIPPTVPPCCQLYCRVGSNVRSRFRRRLRSATPQPIERCTGQQIVSLRASSASADLSGARKKAR
jgi:hypothetical protein